MNTYLLQHEPQVRLFSFFAVFGLVAAWELIRPRRKLVASKLVRWGNNLGLTLLNSLLIRWLFPILAVSLAAFCARKGWGVGNQFDLPLWTKIIVGVILLDFIIYLQHILFHMIPLLWRLHRMHHIDPDLDVTSGARFHPLEIALSLVIKFAAILVIGPAPEAVLVFEVLLNTSAMFNHGNIHLPLKADRLLRWLIVTPDMHRIHHSVIRQETDSNFGFFLSWWDRVLGTYRKDPQAGQLGMTIGIGIFTDAKYLGLNWLLAVPFLKSPTTKDST